MTTSTTDEPAKRFPYTLSYALVCLTLLLTACQSPPHADPASPATDLSLTLFVAGDDQSPNPLAQTSRYIVLPNRTLHVALGSAARARTFPLPYRRLTPPEFDRLLRFIHDHHLLAEPSSPNATQPPESNASAPHVLYHVSLKLGRRSNEFSTTPKESPPTVALLAALAAFRGANLDNATLPD